MDKQTLKRELSGCAKNSAVITNCRLRTFLGCGTDLAADILAGLEYIPCGDGSKKYFISDVAERIMERRER